MIYLELAMLAIGIAAVAFSYRMVKDETAGSEKEDYQKYLEELQQMIAEVEKTAHKTSSEVKEQMSQMSNDKLMGIDEYSGEVLEKIDKTHDEVVFLYDMMNEKQEEIKSLVHSVDTQKAELRDEAVVQFQKMKEQEKILDEMKKEVEVDFLQVQSERSKFREEFDRIRDEYSSLEKRITDSMKSFKNLQEQREWSAQPQEDSFGENAFDTEAAEFVPMDEVPAEDDYTIQAVDEVDLPEEQEFSGDFVDEEPKMVSIPDDSQDMDDALSFDAASVYDAEIARIEEEEAKAREEAGPEPVEVKSSRNVSSGYTPLAEQEKMENHNDEIVSLYKKGRSILEISKMLSLGQGEVKFVIDLYNARI